MAKNKGDDDNGKSAREEKADREAAEREERLQEAFRRSWEQNERDGGQGPR